MMPVLGKKNREAASATSWHQLHCIADYQGGHYHSAHEQNKRWTDIKAFKSVASAWWRFDLTSRSSDQ
jgi:hypothetical protein